MIQVAKDTGQDIVDVLEYHMGAIQGTIDLSKKKPHPFVAPFKKTRRILVHVPDACDCSAPVAPDDILRKLSTTLSRFR
jgi:hypothetical protein